jgi:hypothetical protein
MAFPTRFEEKDFRWLGPEANGRRTLEYVGFTAPIQIPMMRLNDLGGYGAGRSTQPAFSPAERDAFLRCGGFESLRQAAEWFANSR